jgi:hypothetical protein
MKEKETAWSKVKHESMGKTGQRPERKKKKQ